MASGSWKRTLLGVHLSKSAKFGIETQHCAMRKSFPGVSKMRLGHRGELSAQIRDYDICFAEFLKPSGNGQKIMQAILLREAFSLFVVQSVAIKPDAPTVILDVSCGPGDYSVGWTSQIARFLPCLSG